MGDRARGAGGHDGGPRPEPDLLKHDVAGLEPCEGRQVALDGHPVEGVRVEHAVPEVSCSDNEIVTSLGRLNLSRRNDHGQV